jgi:DNA-binding transcriptional regulator YiaG
MEQLEPESPKPESYSVEVEFETTKCLKTGREIRLKGIPFTVGKIISDKKAELISTTTETQLQSIVNTLPFYMRLVSWRKGNKLPQKQAADKLGVSLRAYQYWESGKTKPANTCIKCVEEKIKQ